MRATYEPWKQTLDLLKEKDNFRYMRETTAQDEAWIDYEGKRLLNLSSNDYLGIAGDQQLMKQFIQEIEAQKYNISDYSFSSSSSRLLSGNQSPYLALESRLSELYNKSGALVFNSGYHANLGLLSSLVDKGDVIFSDKLNHASIIDGAKLSDAELIRYKHLDYNHLRILLSKHRSKYNKSIVISESIFSMDGDITNIELLCDLKDEFNCIIIIDEAHSIGTRGKTGLGLCQEQQVIDRVDIITAPLGKGMASVGCFAMMDDTLKSYLINTMRPLIFTTALPPINIQWSLFVLELILEAKDRRKQLETITHYVDNELNKRGLTSNSLSNIRPIIIGDNRTSLEVSERVKNNGIYCLPVRYPTVPKNQARLRLSLTSNITKLCL